MFFFFFLAEQKVEKRKELSRRLAEINARKREEKLAQDEELLGKLQSVKNLYDNDNEHEYHVALEEMELKNHEELEKMISTVHARIEKIKNKILATLNGPVVVEEKVQPALQPPQDMTIDEWVQDTQKKVLIQVIY